MTESMNTAGDKRSRRRRKRFLLLTALGLGGVAAVVTAVLLLRPRPETVSNSNEVPLGVEEAVIIRYAGPRLVARPYRRGASVTLRIANEAEAGAGAARVYDVRYIVNLPGDFELTDYLMSADGSSIDRLPRFPVRGLSSLSKDLETRIREIEDVGVHFGHWYHESLVGLGAFWVLWLLGLVFVGRPKRAAKPLAPPRTPSLDEEIAGCIDALVCGRLGVDGKARLELLLFRRWRDQLALGDCRMAASCRRIEQSEPAGDVYRTLETWLHDPSGRVGTNELLRACWLLVAAESAPHEEAGRP